MARWEESKKWQKKVETLRTKLTEKQRELEHAHKAVQSLKDTLTRSGTEVPSCLCMSSRGRVVKAID